MTPKTVTLKEIMNFAHAQLGSDSPAVSVSDGEFDIVDPWYTTTSNGKYLTNEEAKAHWGEELVNEFIEKATVHLMRE